MHWVAIVRSLPHGGLERVLLHQAQAVQSLGFRAQVLTLEELGPFAPAYLESDISVTSLGGSGASVLATLARLRAWLQRERPDWIQLHMRRVLGLASLARLGLPLRTLLALHNTDPPSPLWFRPLELASDLRLDRVLAVSQAVLENARATRPGIRKVPASVLWNPLDLERAPEPSPAKPSGSKLRVGFVGKLEAKKNPLGFLDAVEAGANQISGALVVGDGPLFDAVQARAKALSIPVELRTGSLDRASFYRDLDALWAPSLREGFGLALGEALAQGTRILMHDLPALREVYGDLPEACFLPPSAPPEAWISRTRTLFEPEVLPPWSEARSQILDRFELPRIREQYRSFYLSLASESSGG